MNLSYDSSMSNKDIISRSINLRRSINVNKINGDLLSKRSILSPNSKRIIFVGTIQSLKLLDPIRSYVNDLRI